MQTEKKKKAALSMSLSLLSLITTDLMQTITMLVYFIKENPSIIAQILLK